MQRLGIRVVAAAIVAAGILVVLGVRLFRRQGTGQVLATPTPARVAPAWLRRFVTWRFNPIVSRLGLVGGRRSPWAYLEHVGRVSGHVYRTPIFPVISADFAYVPLPYGPDVQWARNVRTSGHCRVQVHETVYDLDEPAVITASEHPLLTDALRSWHEHRGDRYLRLHVMSVTPGHLDDAPGAPSTAIPDRPAETPSAEIAPSETPVAEVPVPA